MQELVESQGRRQMEHWLRSHQTEFDSTGRTGENSPTREYLERKFNANKRQKEVNFFKQAQ